MAEQRRGPYVAAWLGFVLAGCSLAFMGVATLAPQIADDRGLPREAIGWFAGLVWTAGLVASLITEPLVARWGPWMVTRLCLVACTFGVLAMASGQVWLFIPAALLIGIGQGLEAPPSSQLLAHHVQGPRRPLYFSLKQTGVQVGAVSASLCLPALALSLGWRSALLLLGASLAVALLLVSRSARQYPIAGPRGGVDPRSARQQSRSWLGVLQEHPDLRRLAVAACAFGATQVCMNAFLVSWMIAERQVSLTTAGVLAATAQAAGLVGRPLWGWVASHRAGSIGVLRWLGAMMSLCALLLGSAGAAMPATLLFLVVALFGLSASGWNGVFLSEVAARSDQTGVAAATAAAMVPLYLGLILGPITFAALSGLTVMSAGFLMLSGVAALGTLELPRRLR